MFEELYNTLWLNGEQWLSAQINDNEFLIGMVGSGLLATLLYMCREIPSRIYHFFIRIVTTQITFNSDNEKYYAVSEYFLNEVVWTKIQRKFHMSHEYSGDYKSTVGYGTHYGFLKQRSIFGFNYYVPCTVTREKEESNATAKFKEQMTINVLGRGNWIPTSINFNINEFVKDKNKNDKIKIQTYSDGYFYTACKKEKRPLNTIFINDNDKDYVVSALRRFIDSKEHYKRKGIPYHFGILLSGKPGTGKTSFIHAIASEFNLSIHLMDSAALNESSGNIFSSVNENPLFVMEDIDVAGITVNRDNNNTDDKVAKNLKNFGAPNLSKVLNFLDGLTTPDGMIVIATTNHKESLDPALIRKGRFDIDIELSFIQWDNWLKMCTHFDRKNPIKKSEFTEIPPVDASFHLNYSTNKEIQEYFKSKQTKK